MIAEIALAGCGEEEQTIDGGCKATKEPSGKPRETPRGIIERVVAPWLRSKADITKNHNGEKDREFANDSAEIINNHGFMG